MGLSLARRYSHRIGECGSKIAAGGCSPHNPDSAIEDLGCAPQLVVNSNNTLLWQVSCIDNMEVYLQVIARSNLLCHHLMIVSSAPIMISAAPAFQPLLLPFLHD